MRKKIFISIFLFLILPIFALSKDIVGVVKVNNSSQGIPFVNIAIKGTFKGTTTDLNGNFKLIVSSDDINKTVCFSCIGYQTKELKISRLLERPEVRLQKVDVELREVTVMPDSTLRSFLRKAYLKIPSNYPNVKTEYQGFFRGSLQSEAGDYLRLAEGVTKAQKTSYNNRQEGTVQIIKTRKYVNPEKTNDFPVNFYGLPHFVHYYDMVKCRESFLKPGKNYQYTYEGITAYEGQKVHEISFTPKENSSEPYCGTLFIHDKTLSYLRIELELTNSGLEKRLSNILSIDHGLNSRKKSILINYSLSDSVCFLKSIYGYEKFDDDDKSVFYTSSSYIVSAYKDDGFMSIPYSEQISIGYVPSIEAENYSDSNWKNYNTLASVLNIDTVRTKETFQTGPSSLSKRDKWANLMRKTEVSYKITQHPYSLSPGLYQLYFNGVNYEKTLSGAGTTLALEMNIGYRLSKHLSAGYTLAEGFSENNLHSNHGPYIEYKLPLKTMGKQIIFCPNLSYVWNKFGRSVGVQDIKPDFNFGGRKLKQDKIKAYPGIKHEGVKLGGSLLYQVSNFIYLNLQLSYYLPVSSKDVLYLEEKSGFFLMRKTAHGSISSTNTQLIYDGQPTSGNVVKYDNWLPSFGLRIMF